MQEEDDWICVCGRGYIVMILETARDGQVFEERGMHGEIDIDGSIGKYNYQYKYKYGMDCRRSK